MLEEEEIVAENQDNSLRPSSTRTTALPYLNLVANFFDKDELNIFC